jgi:hypothetical protein
MYVGATVKKLEVGKYSEENILQKIILVIPDQEGVLSQFILHIRITLRMHKHVPFNNIV